MARLKKGTTDIRITITAPSFERIGGVAGYYRSLGQAFSGGTVDFLTIGSRKRSENIIVRLLRMSRDSLRLAVLLSRGENRIVVINPSLDAKSLLRDGASALIARLFRSQLIVFFHAWKESTERKIRSRFSGVFRFVFLRADLIIVLSSEVAEKIQSFGYKGKIILEKTVVEDSLFAGIAESRLWFSNGKRDDFTVLFLSRIEKTKGIYEAIEAFANLKTRYPNIRLIVAGDGGELASARRRVSDLGIDGIEFIGPVRGENKLGVFLRSDIFILPSYYEGMPVSVLEAFCCGLPVITSKVGGLKDFFIDGAMGYMTETNDPIDLAHLIESLMLNRQRRLEMGKYNYRYAQENCLSRSAAQRMEHLFQDLLQAR